MATISAIERRVNIINEAYKLGYEFTQDELLKYNEEAYNILSEAGVEDAINGSTKDTLVTNLLLIKDNNLEEALYLLQECEINAEAYLCEEAQVFDYSAVDFYGGNRQYFTWADGLGYWMDVCGNIIGSDDYNFKWRWYRDDNGEWRQERWLGGEDEGKIFIDKVCDSLGRVIQLYI